MGTPFKPEQIDLTTAKLFTDDTSPDVALGAAMLETAAATIRERNKDYGQPLYMHQKIAGMWNVQLDGKLLHTDDDIIANGGPITPADVAMMMIGLKLARLMETPNHEDSMVDIAGYAAVLLEIEAEWEGLV